MGMGFAPTWLRQLNPPRLLHMTTLTTGNPYPVFSIPGFGIGESVIPGSWDSTEITGIPGLEILSVLNPWKTGIRNASPRLQIRHCINVMHASGKLTVSTAYSAIIV